MLGTASKHQVAAADDPKANDLAEIGVAEDRTYADGTRR
jgi:hypothetical protein